MMSVGPARVGAAAEHVRRQRLLLEALPDVGGAMAGGQEPRGAGKSCQSCMQWGRRGRGQAQGPPGARPCARRVPKGRGARGRRLWAWPGARAGTTGWYIPTYFEWAPHGSYGAARCQATNPTRNECSWEPACWRGTAPVHAGASGPGCELEPPVYEKAIIRHPPSHPCLNPGPCWRQPGKDTASRT